MPCCRRGRQTDRSRPKTRRAAGGAVPRGRGHRYRHHSRRRGGARRGAGPGGPGTGTGPAAAPALRSLALHSDGVSRRATRENRGEKARGRSGLQGPEGGRKTVPDSPAPLHTPPPATRHPALHCAELSQHSAGSHSRSSWSAAQRSRQIAISVGVLLTSSGTQRLAAPCPAQVKLAGAALDTGHPWMP